MIPTLSDSRNTNLRNLRMFDCQRRNRTSFSDTKFLMEKNVKRPLYEKLQELRDRSGLSLRALAQEMGYAQASSIQRYFSPEYTEEFLPTKIASKFQVALVGKGTPPITTDDIYNLVDKNLIGSIPASSTSKAASRAAKGVPIVGEVAAGLWMEAALFETENHSPSNISYDVRFPPQAQFVVRTRGQSINKIAADGDLLLCVDYLTAGIEPKVGDLALVERTRDGGLTIERTAKRVVKIGRSLELMPESSDPMFQEKVVYREGDEEHVEVKVKAKIVMAFKPL